MSRRAPELKLVYTKKFLGHKQFWNEVITKMPLNVVKPLTLAVIQFCNHYSFIANPIFIVAANGNVQLYQYVLKKIKNGNPQGEIDWCTHQVDGSR